MKKAFMIVASLILALVVSVLLISLERLIRVRMGLIHINKKGFPLHAPYSR